MKSAPEGLEDVIQIRIQYPDGRRCTAVVNANLPDVQWVRDEIFFCVGKMLKELDRQAGAK